MPSSQSVLDEGHIKALQYSAAVKPDNKIRTELVTAAVVMNTMLRQWVVSKPNVHQNFATCFWFMLHFTGGNSFDSLQTHKLRWNESRALAFSLHIRKLEKMEYGDGDYVWIMLLFLTLCNMFIVNLQYISVNTTIRYMYLLQYNIYNYSSYLFRLLWVIFRH